MPRLALSAVVVPLLIVPAAARSQAADPCEPVAARIVSLQGLVEVQAAGSAEWTVAVLEERLCIGDTLRVGLLSRAALDLPDNPVLRLDQLTTLRLVGTTETGSSWLDLLLGAVHFFSRRPHALRIDTPVANAGTEGTEFLMRVAEERTEVVMFEGRVRLTTPEGELLVASGDAAVAVAGQVPARQILARPRDAIAWALYYPPVLAPLAGRDAAPAPLPPGLERALGRVAANDYAGAIAALDEVPPAARDARYLTYRAGVLLNVGRADAAEAALAQALALDPATGAALAQRAVLRAAQNRREEALADAKRAVELSPDSAPAGIALSYALQASFELEAARAALRAAVERSPEDALAWARLAELEQSFGDHGAAQAAAERAVALAPGLARTQMVLGFAALTRIDIDQAKSAFARAIELDSTLPLARLGQGLARIRAGDLDAGARDLEIAVALDPDDSLLRSYLGKAYFEQRRGPLDAAQFQIAKELDPNDPTPWFYDAIRLQTENRPVEALRNLERSIALNDNRAIYRSRLLLDEDLAARGVSLARIYDDLGVEQPGLVQATKSLTLDPANSSAHRFLSDIYASLPRQQTSRASELLQAQLLQPVNLNPVQPILPVTDLNVVAGAGPTRVTLNEFTPLFQRNRAQLLATVLAGNNSTFGDEIIVSGLHNKAAASAGQFHSETDGFRKNNDVNNNLYNVFGQLDFTPAFSVQTEIRHRETQEGDLVFNFDADDFSSEFDRRVNQDTFRFGTRLSPSPELNVLGSFFYTDRREDFSNLPFLGTTFTGEAEDTKKGIKPELQAIFDSDLFNVTVGGGFYDVDVEQNFFDQRTSDSIEQATVYSYTNLLFSADVLATLGLSYDRYEEGVYEFERVNPKLGLQWNVTDSVFFRAAAFKATTSTQVFEQTIEPTQVAGFNQFFDDVDGTKSKFAGSGVDVRLTRNIYVGAEAFWREIDDPIFVGDKVYLEDGDEKNIRAYANWVASNKWVFGFELMYDWFKRSEEVINATRPRPRRVETISIPVSLRHFGPSGVFSGVSGTLVNQDLRRTAVTFGSEGFGVSRNEQHDMFFVVDAFVGYRIPRRGGVLSLEVTNLLDSGFDFQDDNFRTSGATSALGLVRAPMYVPERAVFARLTLSF